VAACVNWTIIYPKRDEPLIVNFEKTLASCAPSLGKIRSVFLSVLRIQDVYPGYDFFHTASKYFNLKFVFKFP
jgi:hypothetical protein